MNSIAAQERVVVVDIDGTIADTRHRQHLVPEGDGRRTDEGWREFHLAAERDKPVAHALEVMRGLMLNGDAEILFLTARPEWMRTRTVEWLRRHVFDRDDNFELLMRPAGNLDRASDMKPKMLAEHFGNLETALERVLLVLEDSEKNAASLTSAGFEVIMVLGHGEHGRDVPPEASGS